MTRLTGEAPKQGGKTIAILKSGIGSLHLSLYVCKSDARNHFSLNFCQCFGCGSDVARTWFGCGSDVVRMWFGRGLDVVRICFGCGSDVFSDLVQTVWQNLRESGFSAKSGAKCRQDLASGS